MLYLKKEDYDKILKHCVDGLPNESCGLIGGTKDGSDKYIKNPSDLVSVGDIVKVKVIKIDMERKKVALSMKV